MKDELADSLRKSISNDLSIIPNDFAELCFDKILSDGLLKDIPIVNFLVAFVKAGKSVKEYQFTKKILYFLNGISDIELTKRVRFMEKHGVNIGSRLILIIDKLDVDEKTKILATLFRSAIYEQIDKEMFLRLAFVVQNSFLEDLNFLKSNGKNTIVGIRGASLYNVGLVSITGINEPEPEKTEYRINSLGEEFIKRGLT